MLFLFHHFFIAMAGFIKFILTMALLAGLVGGGLVIFFADSPFVHRLIPMMADASAGEPTEQIYLRRVDLALRERQPTEPGLLGIYYKEALNQKFDALLNTQSVDKQETVEWGAYLQGKREEYRRHFDAYDKNGDGTLDKGADEWGGQTELFRFTALDENADALLTYDEFWQYVADDVNRAFRRIDSDGNGELTRAEYVDGLSGDSIIRQIVYPVDADGNGAVSRSELESANYRAAVRWEP